MIVTDEYLPQIREKYKNNKIVLGSGTFDLIHRGHITFLKMLREHGDVVVIVITSNKKVTKNKGPTRPVQDENDRALIIDSMKYVDYVVIGPYIDLAPGEVRKSVTVRMAEKLKPDIFLTMKEEWKSREAELTSVGVGEVLYIPSIKENSSTSLIARVCGLNGVELAKS